MATLYHKPKPAGPTSPKLPWTKIGINTLILGSILYLVVSFYPVISIEVGYYFRKWIVRADQAATVPTPAANNTPVEVVKVAPPLPYEPVNKEFSVLIPEIEVNTPVVADVNPGNKKAYLEALNHGAAHAMGTVKPGEVGNSYIFAHSTANILNIEKYAAVFTLLNKLDPGDSITVFHNNKRFDYQVTRKYIVAFNDVSPLIAKYDHPVLTLQTCDPPGTEFQRLIITADLIGSYDN